MAMRNLVEGDCGGSNSLMKLTSHFTQDRALRQEGLLPGRPGLHQQIARPIRDATENELVEDFLGSQRVAMAPQTFHMGSLLQEMREIEEAEQKFTPQRAPAIAELAIQDPGGWAADYLANENERGQGDWSREYLGESGQVVPRVPPTGARWAEEYLDRTENGAWTDQSERDILDNTKWVDDFQSQQAADDNLAKTANEMLENVTDPKLNSSEFMKFVKRIGDGDITVKDNEVIEKSPMDKSEEWAREFNSNNKGGSLVDKWEEEFTSEKNVTDEEFWDRLQKHWEEVDQAGVDGHPWLTEFENTEPYKEYKFEEENPLLNHPDPFQEGIEKLQQGDIPNAVLLFEAAVQANDKHVEAWQYLGTTQAENEQEPAAISALNKKRQQRHKDSGRTFVMALVGERVPWPTELIDEGDEGYVVFCRSDNALCLDLDPGNLIALMSLAVSYTNESLASHACHTLKLWLKNNPKYSGLVPEAVERQPDATSYVSSTEHKGVQELYIRAARQQTDDQIDADVQSGLGVLFNLSGEYDKAVDCFTAALQVRPKDALLWNKLGATLANGSRSEEAVDAYHNALHLAPGFIRSRYNLGIACINLGAHREAVEHFLTALNMQKQSHGMKDPQAVMSQNIWSTLRMAISLLGRADLYHHCDTQNIDDINTAFGINS